MRRVLLSTVALSLIGTAAMAADLPTYEPAPMAPVAAPVYDWSGFYLGINGGWGWADPDFTVTTSTGAVPDLAAGTTGSFDADGFLLGAHAGYNFMWGNFVLGVEGTGQYSAIDGGFTTTTGAADDNFDFEVNSIWLASLRLGVAMDRFMVYAKGGYAGASAEYSFSDTTGANQGSWSQDEWYNGWSIGGGIEAMVTHNIIAGLEYQYIDLGEENFAGAVSGAGTAFGSDLDLSIHEVKARITYKFGGPAAPVMANY